MEKVPLWLTELEDSDVQFIKQFVLASGSLKQIASEYEISYPTVRSRLNQIIRKIEATNDRDDDSYVNLIRRLSIEDKIDFEAASLLIHAYRKEKNHGME